MAQETDEVFLPLLTINHESLEEPIRVVRNTENVTSRGHDYIALPFDITLPTDDGETLPVANLQIDNIERTIVSTIRSIDTPPEVTIEIVLASSPDIVEMGLYDMTLQSASYDAFTVEGSLVIEDIMNQQFPPGVIDSEQYNGLF